MMDKEERELRDKMRALGLRLKTLNMAMGDNVGWFDRFIAMRAERDEWRSKYEALSAAQEKAKP